MHLDERLYKSWLPKGKYKEAVVAVHGMVSHAGYFQWLGPKLNEQGIALFALNRRGNGTAKDMPGITDPEILLQDCRDLVGMAYKHAERVILMPWCAGLGVAAPVAADTPLNGWVLVCPGMQEQLPERLVKWTTAKYTTEYIPVFFDPVDEFSADPKVKEWIKNDPYTLKQVKAEIPSMSAKLWSKLSDHLRYIQGELNCPNTCIIAKQDRNLSPDNVFKTLSKYPGYNIEWRPGEHDIIISDADWLAKRIKTFFAKEALPHPTKAVRTRKSA